MTPKPKRLRPSTVSTEPIGPPPTGEFCPPDPKALKKSSQVWRVLGKVRSFLNWNVFSL